MAFGVVLQALCACPDESFHAQLPSLPSHAVVVAVRRGDIVQAGFECHAIQVLHKVMIPAKVILTS